MDDRIAKAIEFVNYRQTLNNQLYGLKVRCQTELLYSKNGGTFTVDRSLLAFVQVLLNEGQKSSILLDDNDIPIEIENLEEFKDDILSLYFEVVNEYHQKYQKTRKSRTVESILDQEL